MGEGEERDGRECTTVGENEFEVVSVVSCLSSFDAEISAMIDRTLYDRLSLYHACYMYNIVLLQKLHGIVNLTGMLYMKFRASAGHLGLPSFKHTPQTFPAQGIQIPPSIK